MNRIKVDGFFIWRRIRHFGCTLDEYWGHHLRGAVAFCRMVNAMEMIDDTLPIVRAAVEKLLAKPDDEVRAMIFCLPIEEKRVLDHMLRDIDNPETRKVFREIIRRYG